MPGTKKIFEFNKKLELNNDIVLKYSENSDSSMREIVNLIIGYGFESQLLKNLMVVP